MTTKLIRLKEDGVLIEVEVPPGQIQEISGGAAKLVDKLLDQIQPIVVKTCRPVISALKEIKQDYPDVEVDQAAVQIGLSFENEGSIYIAKSKAVANLTVNLVLKTKG
jgi:hypothetical protein